MIISKTITLAGSDTINFGRKVLIKSIIYSSGAAGNITLVFDSSSPFSYSNTWEVSKMILTPSTSITVHHYIDVECRQMVVTTTGNNVRFNVIFDYAE